MEMVKLFTRPFGREESTTDWLTNLSIPRAIPSVVADYYRNEQMIQHVIHQGFRVFDVIK